MNYEYEIISPPSETILRRVSDLKIDLNKFREILNLNIEEFGKLIHDQLKISDKLAYQFSQILGGTEVFWSNRYANYVHEIIESNEQVYNLYYVK